MDDAAAGHFFQDLCLFRSTAMDTKVGLRN